MATPVRNIAPFINKVFYVTSPWWTIRDGKLHRGLDIATSGSQPVYSILTGSVHSIGYNTTRGNWIIIKDDNNVASLYMHLAQKPLLIVGQRINAGDYVGLEGSTGTSTGIHLHVEMQQLINNEWRITDNKEDYIDPTIFMGIDNIKNTSWIYDGIVPPTPQRKKKHFKFYLYSRKRRNMI